MKTLLKSLALLIIPCMVGSPLPAQGTSIQELVRCKASEFEQHPIKIDGLSFTISHFKNGSFRMLFKNTSDNFIPFTPDDLTIIASDGSQYFIEVSYIRDPGRWISPPKLKIGPKAHLQQIYSLNGEVSLPAKIFYNGSLVAEIIK